MPISLFEVLARWGYSEILDGTQAANYDGPVIDALRDNRQQGVDFDDLTPVERYTLAFQCANIRCALLTYFVGVEWFDLGNISRFQLGHVLTPPNVWYPQSQGQIVPFHHYIGTASDDANDARNVQAPPHGYAGPTDPLTLGYCNGHYVLLDGYHRAAALWLYGPHDGILPVYKPQVRQELPQVGAPFV